MEVARHLAKAGRPVAGVVLIDSPSLRAGIGTRLLNLASRLHCLPWGKKLPAFWETLLRHAGMNLRSLRGRDDPLAPEQVADRRHNLEYLELHSLLLSCPGEKSWPAKNVQRRWSRVLGPGLEIREVPGDHASVVKEPQVGAVAGEILRFLETRP